MAYYTYTQKPIGVFVEKDTGNYFEYSVNDEPYSHPLAEDFADGTLLIRFTNTDISSDE